MLAVLLAPPPALGSYGVDRVQVAARTGTTYPPLPATGVPHLMPIREFAERAVDGDGATFAGQPVELTGFVADGDGRPGYRLARFQISCCAADAVAATVRVIGPEGVGFGRDAWVTAVGTFRGTGADGVAELDAGAAHQVASPIDPYE